MEPHPLKTYRVRHQLTQHELAGMFGVSRTTVARWEGHVRRVDRELVPSISAKTGIPAKELRPDLAELMETAQ